MPSVEIIQHVTGLDQMSYDNKLQRFYQYRIFEIFLLKINSIARRCFRHFLFTYLMLHGNNFLYNTYRDTKLAIRGLEAVEGARPGGHI